MPLALTLVGKVLQPYVPHKHNNVVFYSATVNTATVRWCLQTEHVYRASRLHRQVTLCHYLHAMARYSFPLSPRHCIVYTTVCSWKYRPIRGSVIRVKFMGKLKPFVCTLTSSRGQVTPPDSWPNSATVVNWASPVPDSPQRWLNRRIKVPCCAPLAVVSTATLGPAACAPSVTRIT